MFRSLLRNKSVSKVTYKVRARLIPQLESLEERTVLSRVNYAANPSGVGFPHPNESDNGWGGGANKWHLVDNREDYPEWYNGLAFTGGRGHYVEPPGLRQATINFGANRTFQQIVIWHHGHEHIPTTADPRAFRLEYWNGSSWQNITFTRSLNLNEHGCGAGSTPDHYTFSPVTGSKVRYWIDNRLNNVVGNQNEHGWIYEFQVWDRPADRTHAISKMTCVQRDGHQEASGIAVVNTGTNFATYLSGTSNEQGTDGFAAGFRVPYAFNEITHTWARNWPSAGNRDDFHGIAATTDAVYAAGSSWSRTTDTVGDKENKGVTVRFNPANGSETWVRQTPAAPGAFSYGGGETLLDVTTASESGQTYLYATGHSQSNFSNPGRLYVSKFDTNGAMLWTRTDTDAVPYSTGAKVAAFGGGVYVVGSTDDGGARRTYLRRYDAAGGLTWTRTSELGSFRGLHVDSANNALYAVGRTATGAASNFLVEKWDLAGNRQWSRTYDRNNLEDALEGVVLLNGRLFAVGSTRGSTSGGLDGVLLELNTSTGALVNTTVWGSVNDDTFHAITATPTGLHVAATTDGLAARGKDMVYLIFTPSAGGCDMVVTNTNDNGPGSLRQAMLCANTNSGRDTISFNIPGAGVKTISLTSPLPNITDPIILDGYTQPGASRNTLAVGNNANLLIELNGANAGANASGLTILAGNSTVRGLVINRFTQVGIVLQTNGGNIVEGNFIGTDANGAVDLGNRADGVFAHSNSPRNTIGGTTPAARNLLSGNDGSGAFLFSSDNLIQGNYVGTNRAGTSPVGNTSTGLSLVSGVNNVIGGTAAGAGNVVSGNGPLGPGINSRDGITVSGAGARDNLVQGNFIGTDASGTARLANRGSGLRIGTANNRIGGASPAARNVISGNQETGVLLLANANVVEGNYIGTDKDGLRDLGNDLEGVYIWDAANNTVGGVVAAAGNLISGNDRGGVLITGGPSTGNRVQGNIIGANAAGAAAIPNVVHGVQLRNSASNNLIGGNTQAARNVISGNAGNGVSIESSGATTNRVQGNYIGTNTAGMAALPNQGHGVLILNAPNNTVGGAAPGAGNLISGNGQRGVLVNQSAGNRVQGNLIGLAANGLVALGNGSEGVLLSGGSSNNLVGGTELGSRNFISGNRGDGVSVYQGATGNQIQGNYIGTNQPGDAGVANQGHGVIIAISPNNTVGGTAVGAGNLISGNSRDGVRIEGAAATGNRVEGNLIGTDRLGLSGLGNGEVGVRIFSANNTVGGVTLQSRNLISGNGGMGVLLEGEAATGNRIQNNRIGTDANGDPWGLMPNYYGGVYVYLGSGNRVEGNEIAFNGGDGVTVYYAVGNTITQNRIWDNADLGIDHYDDGVSPGYTPELYSAWSLGPVTFVQGQLVTFLPYTEYRLEFFVNSDSDPSGYGEGMIYLGTSQVWTDETGVGYFQEGFNRFVPPGYCVSATATEPDGTTWEFGNCVQVDAGSAPGGGGGDLLAGLQLRQVGAERRYSGAVESNAAPRSMAFVEVVGSGDVTSMRTRADAQDRQRGEATPARELVDLLALEWLDRLESPR